MAKKDFEIVPESDNSFDRAISNAFQGFGSKPGDKLTLERRDGSKLECRRTDTDRVVTKGNVGDRKFHKTRYQNNRIVYGFSEMDEDDE